MVKKGKSKKKPRFVRAYEWDENYIVRFRDWVFAPLIKLLALMSIPPAAISYLSVLFMLGFIASIFFLNFYWGAAFVILAMLMDALDGGLARYIKKGSDRGKFIDVVCDGLVFTLFVLGLGILGAVPWLWVSLVIYFMLSSRVFRGIYHSKYFKSKWKFKAVIGYIPMVISAVTYIAFLLAVLVPFWTQFILWYFFNLGFIAISIILIIDSIMFYFKVLKK